HRFPEAPGGFGDLGGIVVEGGGSHDRRSAGGRVAGFEDSGSHEHTLGTELHHHGRIGGGGDPAGGEQHHRKAAGLGHLGHQFVRRLQFLGGHVQLVGGQAGQARDLGADGAHMGGRVGHVPGSG